MQDGEELRQGPISDVPAVLAILINAAKEFRATSYAEVLDALGLRFTWPKMRALCKTLDAINTAGSASSRNGSFWQILLKNSALWTRDGALARR